ncbi:4,5-DOPA dioxygenase extradiol [Pedobacter sp. MW01-1-1]|uniref:4,5-DOPA-extradiol-dioxygenase n=1 Tax=Pedobacter sp. MW01-1-1 TaxID=3383027 RepID=UPI003FED664B
MSTLSQFRNFTQGLAPTALMPALFIGHGSPMNGIELNEFSQSWIDLAKHIPTPSAVLVVSAHWYTPGTFVTAMDFPKTIHDFGGFPQALFDVQYPAPGDSKLAQTIKDSIQATPVELDHDWGLDHGAWSVVQNMYPNANIPVLQLSIDYRKSPKEHFEIAQELYALRKKGVLILGSGNIVHNLRMVNWQMMQGGGYDWAIDINEKFKSLIANGDYNPLFNYRNLGSEALLAVPTPDHYLPLMYSLGVKNKKDDVLFFNDKAIGGSLTMTSVLIHS